MGYIDGKCYCTIYGIHGSYGVSRGFLLIFQSKWESFPVQQSFATFSTLSSHYIHYHYHHLDLTWFDSKSQTLLVGGFNPSEKYGSQLGWNSQYIMGKYTPNIPNHINHQPETYVQLCSIIPFNYDGCGIPPTRQNLKLWVSKPPTSINK